MKASGQARYQPIVPNERETFGDMVAGVVATAQPRETPIASVSETPVSAEATVEATATLDLTPETQASATALSTQVATEMAGRALVTAIVRAAGLTTATSVRLPATGRRMAVDYYAEALAARTPTSIATSGA